MTSEIEDLRNELMRLHEEALAAGKRWQRAFNKAGRNRDDPESARLEAIFWEKEEAKMAAVKKLRTLERRV